jgi:Tfp pilus assembly protein PilN
LLRELSLTLPENVWYESMATDGGAATAPVPTTTEDGSALVPILATGPSSITIIGYAMTQDDVAQFLARLGVVPEFSSVQLQSANEEKINDQRVIKFVVLGALKPIAGGTP